MSEDRKSLLKRWLENGEVTLHPPTFPQRELWEASAIPVGAVANHICTYIQVRGELAPKDCEASLLRVVERQEALRLSFLPGREQPLQMIRSTGETAMRFRDVPASASRPEALDEMMQETFREPFDTVRGPLYRVDVLRRSADDILLVFAIHHAIADGWSLGVFVEDLCAAYALRRMGMDRPLPPVALSYSAWSAAERAFWQPAELEKRAEFWKRSLAGAPRIWPDSPPRSSTELRRWATLVPGDVGRAVRELAKRSGATLFSTLLTAFQIALSRWTGATDIVVGTPVANRTRQGVRETMGYCSGIVPLRAQVDPDRKFSDSLRVVHGNVMDAFANAMPFAELVRALNDSPSPGHNPIYDIRFALQNHPLPDVEVPGLSVQLKMRSTGTARASLGCEVTEMGDALEVVWLSRTERFSQADVEDIHRIFRGILAEFARSPETRAHALTT